MKREGLESKKDNKTKNHCHPFLLHFSEVLFIFTCISRNVVPPFCKNMSFSDFSVSSLV